MSERKTCGQDGAREVLYGHLLWATFGSFCVFAWAHHAAFLNPYIINDDVRQQLYWMQRWVDPQLYPSSLLNDYARMYVPWGVQAVYYCASFFVDPIFFSKVLSGGLYVFMGTLMYLVGQRVAGRRMGLAAVSVFWLMPFFLHAISGGLARAFAGPLLVLFIYGNVCMSRQVVAVALLLQSVFIPYIFILCGGAVGLAWIFWRAGLVPKPPFLGCLFDFAIAACAVVTTLAWRLQMMRAGFGPLPSVAEMSGRPEFSAAGRFLVLPVPSIFHELFIRPWEFIAPFRDKGPVVGIIGVVVILLVVALSVGKARWSLWAGQIPWIISLAGASLGLYCSARLLLFQLFLPSRYLEYSVNVGYCLLLGAVLHGFSFSTTNTRRQMALGGVIMALLLGGWRSTNIGLYDYSGQAPLCRLIREETPKRALIAGFPSTMDNVLTFGQRNVFASYELSHPWSMGYWERLEPRLRDMFNAYYARDIQGVVDFCRKNDIGYIVVDERHFSPEFMNGCPFFAPFNAQIRELAARNGPYALLLQVLPARRVGLHLRVIDASKLEEYAGRVTGLKTDRDLTEKTAFGVR